MQTVNTGITEFQQELDRTNVISKEFKVTLIHLLRTATNEAFEKGLRFHRYNYQCLVENMDLGISRVEQSSGRRPTRIDASRAAFERLSQIDSLGGARVSDRSSWCGIPIVMNPDIEDPYIYLVYYKEKL